MRPGSELAGGLNKGELGRRVGDEIYLSEMLAVSPAELRAVATHELDHMREAKEQETRADLSSQTTTGPM